MRVVFTPDAFAQLQALTAEQRQSAGRIIAAVLMNTRAGWYETKTPEGRIVRIAPGFHVNVYYLVTWEEKDGELVVVAITTFPFPSQTEYEERTQP